jgi:hypothetical protein
MNYYDDEDDEDFLDEELTMKAMKAEKEEREKVDFIKNCNDAYLAIKADPDSIISTETTEARKENLINAVNRMAALFILQEEYEKCKDLKVFMESKIPDSQLKPSIDQVKKFLGQ